MWAAGGKGWTGLFGKAEHGEPARQGSPQPTTHRWSKDFHNSQKICSRPTSGIRYKRITVHNIVTTSDHFSLQDVSPNMNTQKLKKKFIDFIIKIHYIKTGQSVPKNSTCFNLIYGPGIIVYQSYNNIISTPGINCLAKKHFIGNIDPFSWHWRTES